MTLQDWVKAARPKTLTASWIPVVVGTALAFKQTGYFNYFIFACAVMSSLFIQVATNYINDAIDFKKGSDTAERIGPKRMTASGVIDYHVMMRGGFVALLFACLCGLPVVIDSGWPILVLGVLSSLLAFAYTGGPFPLAYIGLGDFFVYLFFGLAAVCGSYYIQAKTLTMGSFVAGTQIGLLSMVLIAINNFRDMHQDAKSGKRTLAVRFGSGFMRSEIIFCLTFPFLLGIYWAWTQPSFLKAGWIPVFSLPLAAFIIMRISSAEPNEEFNKFLAKAGALHMLFGILLSIGILSS